MEVDHDMLWDQQKKRYMNDFVSNIYEKLKEKEVIERGSFCIPFDHLNAFTFHFSPKHIKPHEVKAWDVPIFLTEQTETEYAKIVDVTSDIM